MSLLDEVAKSVGVLVSVSTSETLVGHVKEWVVTTLLDGVANGPPLLFSWIDTGGVVCASVQQDDAVLGHLLDILDHAFKVETDGVLVVVPVLFHLQTRVLEDCIVVGPRRVGNVDGLCAGVVPLEESTAYPESTSAGDGLCDGNSALRERRRVGAVSEES